MIFDILNSRVERNRNMQLSSTTFQNFECGWPRLGLEDRKNGKKISILEIFSKVEVQKFNICACLSRQIKFDEKKITLDILCCEFLPGHLIEIDHF
jgi:hypothetical protein